MQNRIKALFKINPVASQLIPQGSQQIEQIAQGLVENKGKLNFKKLCFP